PPRGRSGTRPRRGRLVWPQRSCSPIGRGRRLKPVPVWVRVPPGARLAVTSDRDTGTVRVVTSVDDLDPRTPVVIGVGQVADPIDADDYHGWSPVELGAEAARRALLDAGIGGESIDTIAAVRQFEVSSP